MTGSVTHWIRLLQAGDTAAADPLFRRYFDQLVVRCQARLAGRPRAADGQDVAHEALATFFRRTAEQRYPDLADRTDLWKLLLVISGNKAKSLLKREARQKRGGGRVAGENLLAGGNSDEGWSLDSEIGEEPTPEMVASLAETLAELERRLAGGELRQIAQWKLAGYENTEIAEKLDCAVATVERRLKLIRTILRESDRDDCE